MMKRIYCVAILLAALSSGGSNAAECLPGGLVVIVNKANPVESVSMAQLRKLILGDVRAWQDKQAVVLISREPNSKVFQCELSSVVRLSVSEYQRYVINAEFRGDEPLAIQVANSDGNAARMVGGAAGGMAVVEANSVAALGGAVKVLHIEGKAVGQPGYPLQ